MKLLSLMGFVLISASVFAQMRNMAVDQTATLASAKRVSIFINVGPTIPAPYEPNFDRAKKQVSEKLKKLKLELVPDPKDADLVLVITEYNQGTGAISGSSTAADGNAYGTARELICLCDRLDVYKGGQTPTTSDAPIWSKTETCGYSWPLNRTFDKLEKAMKRK